MRTRTTMHACAHIEASIVRSQKHHKMDADIEQIY